MDKLSSAHKQKYCDISVRYCLNKSQTILCICCVSFNEFALLYLIDLPIMGNFLDNSNNKNSLFSKIQLHNGEFFAIIKA